MEMWAKFRVSGSNVAPPKGQTSGFTCNRYQWTVLVCFAIMGPCVFLATFRNVMNKSSLTLELLEEVPSGIET